MSGLVHHGLDLFNYDQRISSQQVLISNPKTPSNVEYDEYVVYKKEEESSPSSLRPDAGTEYDGHIAHHFTRNDAPGSVLLDLAFRQGHFLDRDGNFRPPDEKDTQTGMEGRIRRVICFTRKTGLEGMKPILSMTPEDVAAMELHPATLQYANRVTTESRFWSRDRTQLSIILSFSEMPKTPCDFLSMTYNVNTRNATILVRQSWEPRRNNQDNLDEYDHRLESCRAHWAHPLVMPVVLLQVQFMRCEEAVADNSVNVAALENDVSNIAGFDLLNLSEPRRPLRRRTNSSLLGGRTAWGPMTMTNLMKRAHEVLKDSIKLLDTIRWMERAVKVLIIAGDELAERMGSSVPFAQDFSMLSPSVLGEWDRGGPPPVSPVLAPTIPRIRLSEEEQTEGDSLGTHWHEIRQYLDGLLRLCMSSETDRRVNEARCRAQIDMIYSKMAQEDNILNARMAVASSRDNSSMKALAVITAVFLPGEFLASLFGMSMFDWLGPDNSNGSFGSSFAVYWATAVPLTAVILFIWRAWWVTQDRYFRRHLSQELSEERFWTADGKPRSLEHGFVHDFFYLSARREEKVKNVDELELEMVDSIMKSSVDGGSGVVSQRQRQILAARQWSVRQRGTSVSV